MGKTPLSPPRQAPITRWVGLGALVLIASGCALPGPAVPCTSSAQPAIVVPQGWSETKLGMASGGGVASERLVAWWQRFNEPLLSAQACRALSSNTAVIVTHGAPRQARALRDVAAAALLLTIGAVASVQGGTSRRQSTGNRFELGLNTQWMPDAFGARSGALDVGNASAKGSAASLGDVQVRVAACVVLRYVLLRALQTRRGIANDNLVNQWEVLRISDQHPQAGLVSVLDVAQAHAAATQTQAALVGQPLAALQAELKD